MTPVTFTTPPFDSDIDEAWAQVSVGLLTVISEDAPPSKSSPS
ncbi:hypothetical protein FQN60_008557 [Etheostoma spectabile]|uniref:Uncharacterized protein n=1 Tax=Etheostoma spectabile TaxID=54343 RepID=A0A5J5CJH2_9PERO|nr:hypothetical protein FQN60_008557 [Etheostoma spectabile]